MTIHANRDAFRAVGLPAQFRRLLRALSPAGVALAVLAGCGADEVPRELPRPVLVAQAHSATGAGAVQAYAGDIRAREETTLAFRVGGRVLARRVDVGARVRAGDVLAELDPSDQRLNLDAVDAQLAAAQAELTRARADHRRLAALAEEALVSRSSLDQQTAALRAAEAQVRAIGAQRDIARNQSAYTALRAPRDGVIAGRSVEVGQVVAAGQPAFTLAADGGREAAFAIPELRADAIRIGQPVLVEVWNRPGERLPAKIREMSPAADPQARTFAARAVLDDADARVALGQSVRVYLTESAGGALELPLAAVQAGDQPGSTAVWVVDLKTNKVRRTPVRIGPMGAQSVPVLSGIAAQDWVVIAGAHLLDDGQAVRPVGRDNQPVELASVEGTSAQDKPTDRRPITTN
jgi:membrane fusion protein, multidrug efflux system